MRLNTSQSSDASLSLTLRRWKVQTTRQCDGPSIDTGKQAPSYLNTTSELKVHFLVLILQMHNQPHERRCNTMRSIIIITAMIISEFRIFCKHEACSGSEPHLHNSPDLIRSALCQMTCVYPLFRWWVLSAYREDLKPQEKISINAGHRTVSHSQLLLAQGQNTLKRIIGGHDLMSVAVFSITAGVGLETWQKRWRKMAAACK